MGKILCEPRLRVQCPAFDLVDPHGYVPWNITQHLDTCSVKRTALYQLPLKLFKLFKVPVQVDSADR